MHSCAKGGNRWVRSTLFATIREPLKKETPPPKKLEDPTKILPDFHLNPGQNLLEKHIVLIFQYIVNPNFSSNFKTSLGGTFA